MQLKSDRRLLILRMYNTQQSYEHNKLLWSGASRSFMVGSKQAVGTLDKGGIVYLLSGVNPL